MNKTLRRILVKNLDLTSREELETALSAFQSQIQTADGQAKFSNFQSAWLDTLDAVDKALSDFDRMIDMRDRSLSVSSREMTALNQELTAQSEKQKAVLDQLHRMMQLLQEGSGQNEDQENDLQKLVTAIGELVKSQINAARDLEILFEEGLNISSAMTFLALEKQARNSVCKIADSQFELRVYFCGQLFGLNEKIQFYTANAANEPDKLFDLQDAKVKDHDQFMNVTSSKDRSILAIIRFEMEPARAAHLITRVQPLLPNIAATLENIRLLQDEKRKQHLESELQTARFVQQALLPSSAPRVVDGTLEISGFFQNASECGGDWWTYFQMEDGRHAVLVGDVTGHGTGSAIVCAVVKGFCDSLIGRKNLTLAQILSEVNQVVFGISRSAGRAMTMAAVAVDAAKGEVTFANAGHPQPILVRQLKADAQAREVRIMIGTGNILGVSDKADYSEKKAILAPGDQLVLYSDGLTERISRAKDTYGENRLCRLLRAAKPDLSAADLNREIVRDMQDFAMGREPADDITSVVIRNIAGLAETATPRVPRARAAISE